MIDLHMHSNHSDGSSTVEELLEIAKLKGLKTIAITDHDLIHDLNQIESDIELIEAVEVSTYDFVLKRKIDLLIYGVNLMNSDLNLLIKETNARRHEQALLNLDNLRNHGYQFEHEKVGRSARGIIYKQHIMETLIENGYEQTLYGHLYQQLFKNKGLLSQEIEYPDIEHVLEIARAEKLCPVIAHPGLSKNLDQIERYVKLGIRGIETYHSSHDVVTIENCHRLAIAYGLGETGGSDFHGSFGNEPELGIFPASETQRKGIYRWIKQALNKSLL